MLGSRFVPSLTVAVIKCTERIVRSLIITATLELLHLNRLPFNLRISLEVDDVSALDHPLLGLAFDLEHLVLGQHESAHYGKPAISQMQKNQSFCQDERRGVHSWRWEGNVNEIASHLHVR